MFTHLHLHTEYSLLDGMARLPPLVERARELGMDSLAITDHGVLYGVIDFYLACKQAGIKPILGCEVYIAPQSRFSQGKNPFHLILLARDRTGYNNLIQLVTKAHVEGFFYKPRVDKELLSQHSQGLIALSACPQGELGQLIGAGREEEAARAARWYKEVFGDFYLELQPHPIPEVEIANRGLLTLSRELGLPLVATNDVHYINREDAPLHDLLLCIQTNTSIHNEKRLKMAGDFFYLRPPQEMAQLFSHLPQAVENTQRIAQSCELELEFGRIHLPEVELPPGRTADEYLGELARQGFSQRYPQPTPEARERLRYELEVIRHTQFANYFLVVWDIVSFTRRQGILFGVRGSAASSLVLYCLGVTEIDPLEHRLVFERFLNIERRELPDIDLDFQDDRRQEVINYVTQKYGQERVAQIITFGTLGARAALRDVGRALGMLYSQVDRVARLVPAVPGMTLERALKENRELSSVYQQDETVRQLIDSSQKLEGVARHASTHAAGVVISREPLTQYLPLQRPVKGTGEVPMTQFSMESIAQIGLLKMDLLGLANLTILARAKELVRQRREVAIDLQRLPQDDPETLSLLASGETTGIFQLEGAGMRRLIRELKPSAFSDIAALVALYRPGPMEHIPTFIRAKHGQEPIRYPHPSLEEILKETYGVIVYQEQVLFIVQALAGYSLGEADIFRKAMGKKIPEAMKRERQNFIDRAKKKGFSPEVAVAVFNLIEPFAGYAFNKAHSVSYAMLAYQTAYLKAHYPGEYMVSLLNTYADKQEKVASAIAECHRLGISVLSPDVNHSHARFSLEGEGAIRFGLSAIKNVGEAAVEPLLQVREKEGAFQSIEDLCRRVDIRAIGRRALESLVKVGALDFLADRGALLHHIDRLLALSHHEQHLKETGQTSMFNLWGQRTPLPLPSLELEPIPLPAKETLAWEKELLGVFLSDNPLKKAISSLGSAVTTFCGQIDASMEGQQVVVAGMVTAARQVITRDKRLFISASLEDLDGSIEVTVWPEALRATQGLWQEGQLLLIQGKVRVRGEEVSLVCERAQPYPPSPPSSPRRLIIEITPSGDEAQDRNRLQKIRQLLLEYPGEDEVQLAIATDQGVVAMKWQETVSYCPELHRQLTESVGEVGIRVEGGINP